MSYADTLLSTGERVIRRERQHWFVLAFESRWTLGGLAVGTVLLILSGGLGTDGVVGGFRNLVGYAVLVLFVAALAWAIWTYLRWMNQEFVITNRRVIQCQGVINKKATDSSLEKINDAMISQSVFGRIFGFGDLDVLTASESGIEEIRMLDDPIRFKKAMLDAKHELERDLMRPVAPSPPLRAGGGPGPAGGPGSPGPESVPPGPSDSPSTPVAAAATAPKPVNAPAERTMAPEEVTRALGDLADLRERGVLTAEEFEAKKADLLRRL